ncbi:MAG: hypothetical protein VKL39_09045 [Leptolyngbyaceae bacterium]|nr:hypothetical protein [Leptolyngbyaceae bacterium]
MKYFFLSDGWTVGRVWELGGLWNEPAWRRPPHIRRQKLYLEEKGERLWLYSVEDAVLMVEVKPDETQSGTSRKNPIGQVVLKRLITAEQAIALLCSDDVVGIGLEQHLDQSTLG